MIQERAIILALETPPSSSDTVATLEIERKVACGLCGQTRGCGNSIWSKLFSPQSTIFKAHNSINAQVGQSVIIGIDERSLLTSALLLYVLPLVTMLFASILSMQITQSDIGAMLGAALGLLVGFAWLKGYTLSGRYIGVQYPQILRIASDETEVKFAE